MKDLPKTSRVQLRTESENIRSQMKDRCPLQGWGIAKPPMILRTRKRRLLPNKNQCLKDTESPTRHSLVSTTQWQRNKKNMLLLKNTTSYLYFFPPWDLYWQMSLSLVLSISLTLPPSLLPGSLFLSLSLSLYRSGRFQRGWKYLRAYFSKYLLGIIMGFFFSQSDDAC